MDRPGAEPATLTRYAWLSITAAVVTIALKGSAYALTSSVGLLSDALESLVNLVAAVVALIALLVAGRPPDTSHEYGHGKAEYVSATIEGLLVLGAAVAIIWTAVPRLGHPRPLEHIGVGLAVSSIAALVNLVVALTLARAGRHHRSATLTADGRHLLTDVWTSVGVVGAVLAVHLTGWTRLDPLIALAVALNVLVVGGLMVRRSMGGLMDRALSASDHETIRTVLARYEADGVRVADLRTREAGRRRFVSVRVLVPGDWTVRRGHDLLDRLEAEIRHALPDSTVFTHLEPNDVEAAHEPRDGTRCGPDGP